MAVTISDETLIQQALAGRQSAYAMLVKRYEKYVFTLALRFVKNREDAHEVAQDCFMRMFRYMADFRGDCKFTTWLYKIVYSTALNHLRKNKPDILSLDDDVRPLTLKDEGAPDASSELERDDRNAALHRAIAMLSHDDAGILTLFYLYEQSLDEICQIMDLSMSNAKTKLCRARQRLKSVLETNFQAEYGGQHAPGAR
ncbi:MAG: sigma-70 family RNA polymerase sigma factor [Saprospirales bacterium]|jgi:RNA polymerase sigma factor (sigma-70 family)|nr:sigma-70 family RNA polymerase sigma factor [Saprospirales bacterium]MBK8923313.1 sigma-70 family RNA polymerase sigma factor [Saprospirales bacterium]